MSKYLIWFIIFLIVNLIVTALYLIIGLFSEKTDRRLIIMRCIVMFCAPGVGALLFFLSWLSYMIFFREEVDLSDVVFSKDREKEIIRTNEERDRNVVPLEEAIEVTGNTELRNLVMSIAQGDVEKSLASISLALNSEDSETAHYAASVLQETLNEFRLKVSKDYQVVQRRGENIAEEATDLARYMNKYLAQKVFTDMEQKSFVGMLENVVTILHEEKPEAVTSELYEMVAMRLLEINEYEKCEVWANRSMDMYPNTLSSYTNKLKLYFNSENKNKFFMTLEDLKKSSVIIDKDTLALIRTFQ